MGINKEYLKALKTLKNASFEVSPRGMKVKEVLVYTLRLDNPLDNVVTLEGFQTNVNYAEEELKWYYSGSNRIDFSDTIQRTWQKFSDDGEHVNSAYGHRIFGKYPGFCNQWEWVKDKLVEDPDSRQAIMNINSYFDKEKPTKDFPCTVGLQLFIRNNKLNWVTMMRSQDIYFGMRNDIYCFTKMQERMAKELYVGLGQYIHTCNSLHIYEKQYGKLEALLKDCE